MCSKKHKTHLLKLMPLMHSSSSVVEVGTIWPPAHRVGQIG